MKSNPASLVVSLITTGAKLSASKKKKDLKDDIIKRYDKVQKELIGKYGKDFKQPNFGKSLETEKYLNDEKGILKKEYESLRAVFKENYTRNTEDTSVSDRLLDSVFGGPNAFNFSRSKSYDISDALADYRDSPEYDVLATDPAAPVSPVDLSTRESKPKPNVQAQIADVQEKTAKGKGIREAARFAAQRSAERLAEQRRQQQSNLGYDISGKSDQGRGYVDSFKDNPNYVVQGNTVYAKEKDGTRGGAVGGRTEYGGTYGSTKSYRDAVDEKNKANEDRYEQARSDFFGNIFNDGGLVAKPQMKKKKTTQRRKGLGTRP